MMFVAVDVHLLAAALLVLLQLLLMSCNGCCGSVLGCIVTLLLNLGLHHCSLLEVSLQLGCLYGGLK